MSIPFALSLSKYVNSAGTDVGFASLLAVALLAILYFAGARETRTLRDQLEDAHTRISSLEQRIAQSLRNQAARAAAPAPAQTGSLPGVVPPPSVAQPMGSAVARVQRESFAAVPVLLGAPSGAGAPSLGSATKLIPSPVAAPVPVAQPMAIPAAATVAAAVPAPAAYEYEDDDYSEEFGPEDTMFVPATAGAAANGSRSGGGVAAPPRMLLRDEDPSGPVPRRTIPTVDTGPSRPRVFAGRMAGAIAAVVVVAIIVVVLLLVTGSGGSKKKTQSAQARTQTTTTVKKKTPVFNPASVKVSVLNGTAVSGLAGDVGKDLTGAGYTVPAAAVTNASEQTVTTTVVSYRQGYQAAAYKVAQALKAKTGVAVTTVQAANQTSINSCGTPEATGTLGACPANVIVTVGTDLASVASGSSGA